MGRPTMMSRFDSEVANGAAGGTLELPGKQSQLVEIGAFCQLTSTRSASYSLVHKEELKGVGNKGKRRDGLLVEPAG